MLTDQIASTIATDYPHIVRTPGVMGGEPRLDGHRIRVRDIVAMRDVNGHTPEQVIELDYPHLTLAQVYAALAYAEDHREELARFATAEEDFVREFQKSHPQLIAGDMTRPATE